MTGFIYQIKNKLNGKLYIGQTTNFDKRKYYHLYDLKRNKHRNKDLQSDWDELGEDSFEFSIIETCNKSKLCEREVYWIRHYGGIEDCYNCTEGGLGSNGFKHSEESIKKISENKTNPSQETRNRISESAKKRKASPETREKISQSLRGKPSRNLGKKHSVETKRKIGEASKGRQPSEETRKKISESNKGKGTRKVYSNVKIFDSIKETAKYFNINYSTMKGYLSGRLSMPKRLIEFDIHYL